VAVLVVLVVLVAMVLVLASALAGSAMGQVALGQVALGQVASAMDLAQGAHFCNHRFHCTLHCSPGCRIHQIRQLDNRRILKHRPIYSSNMQGLPMQVRR